MIKLSNAIVVANTNDELVSLQELLAASYPEFTYSVINNTGEEKDNFPFRLLVEVGNSAPTVSMPAFFDFLLAKIDQLNNPA